MPSVVALYPGRARFPIVKCSWPLRKRRWLVGLFETRLEKIEAARRLPKHDQRNMPRHYTQQPHPTAICGYNTATPSSQGRRKREKKELTHVNPSILIRPRQRHRNLDITTGKTKLIPRLQHTASIRLVMIIRSLKRCG